MRKEYAEKGLLEADMDPNPLTEFERWLTLALDWGVPEPNAMTLATVDAQGHPDARLVLLKGVDAGGFTFFTNQESAKAVQLGHNPAAALLFAWLPMQRQVKVLGRVTVIPRPETEEYFQKRPRGSQLGAWASAQSQPVGSRALLDARLAQVTLRFGEGVIPAPPHWGGYRLEATALEFWQGRANRMHDRVSYVKHSSGWVQQRLCP